MTEMPVPYAGDHNGPTRVLQLHTRRGVIAKAGVTVGIDGAHYHQRWGRAAFEIPADKPVHVAVSQGSGQIGVAATVLTPEQPSELEYRGPAALYLAGTIGAPGTVRQRGCLLQLAIVTLAPLTALALVIVIATLLSR
ncbi:hypothetical protein [Actinomadura madurae]|uniref:hypothetical protein n=1 Tax=Actinomadura madurae TaxID=1993 RepID=UPI002026E936|nr:hypothetical protein [Actinomadura madurae]MCP9951944.1 hypothetical protein [Actinomadura madurae]MCP9981189.1 hypothetical protein [Actinomadura madurae]MCQ0007317.1 hypothetical protein [Actinomadura madurae]MCQ0017379.1 hypothetical protein [Actinomadura madurae]URM97486.1 hypothetical protein LUW76_25745 [Actinomadura madurae]